MSSLIVEVCRIDSVNKHPNADKLSFVTVKGWNCIVGLDQYKVGDLVVFVPPDSIVPTATIDKYNLEYLKSDGRVKTVKLRGCISQGLILDLPEGKWKVGDDVAGVLGIKKWEPQEAPIIRGANMVSKKKTNPNFSKYTEIENINNFNNVFQEGDDVIITEKIHGTNARFGVLPITIHSSQPLWYKIKAWWKINIKKQTHEFVYGSHNVQLGVNYSGRNTPVEAGNVWERIAKRYNLANIIPKDTIVYGEIYGKGVQDLTYGLDGIDFIVFDMKGNGIYLDADEVIKRCESMNLKYVPILYYGKYDYGENYNGGNSNLCEDQIKEGSVIKMLHEGNNPVIGRKILKCINKQYLIRKGGTEYK